jgi:hypothetical protein
MKKRTLAGKSSAREVIGRERFAQISAAEGLRLTPAMKRAFADFDRQGLSAAERRRAIIGKFKAGAG